MSLQLNWGLLMMSTLQTLLRLRTHKLFRWHWFFRWQDRDAQALQIALGMHKLFRWHLVEHFAISHLSGHFGGISSDQTVRIATFVGFTLLLILLFLWARAPESPHPCILSTARAISIIESTQLFCMSHLLQGVVYV